MTHISFRTEQSPPSGYLSNGQKNLSNSTVPLGDCSLLRDISIIIFNLIVGETEPSGQHEGARFARSDREEQKRQTVSKLLQSRHWGRARATCGLVPGGPRPFQLHLRLQNEKHRRMGVNFISSIRIYNYNTMYNKY